MRMPGSSSRSANSIALFASVGADPEIAAHDMEREISPHHRKDLRRSPHPLAKRAGATKDRTHFRRCIPPRSNVGGAERTEELQFASVPIRRRRQRFKQLQTLRQMANRLDMGASVSRPQAQPSDNIRPPSR